MNQDTSSGENSSAVRARSLSVQKQVVFSILLIVMAFSVLELITRVGAYFVYGRSPYFLYYGFASAMADEDPEGHSAAYNGYFKFQPSRTLHQYGMFQEPTPIRINSFGFRGPDFTRGKSGGVVRIICLGESSTFGFFDRDDYTYPSILQRLLPKETAVGGRFEVINAGIPHVDSDNILAMLKGEILSYEPDIITIYAGYNDAAYVMDASVLENSLRWIHAHVATYVALKRVISAVGGPELYSRWASYNKSGDQPAYVKRQVNLHVARYNRNIEEIIALAGKAHVRVVVMKQALDIINNQKKNGKTSFTYQEEVASVEGRIQRGEVVSAQEVTLLVHSALMDRLEEIARAKDLQVVDNIAIANAHPEYFASYVHLTEAGNQALAETMAKVLLP